MKSSSFRLSGAPGPIETTYQMQDVEKLIDELDEFIRYMKQHDEFRLHRHVDQFYYMEKKVEIKLLFDQLTDLNERIVRTSQWLDSKYREVFCRLCADRRWINSNDIRDN